MTAGVEAHRVVETAELRARQVAVSTTAVPGSISQMTLISSPRPSSPTEASSTRC